MDKKLTILFLILFSLITAVPAFSDNLDDATALYNEAIDFYKQDNIDKSIELFTKTIELEPDFYEAHYNLTQILMYINRNEEAFEELKTMLKLRPDDSEILYNLGRVQYKRGYLSSSFEYLNKIKPEAPQYESAKLLIAKIENRQKELDLEAKIKEKNNITDTQGRAQGFELNEIQTPSGVVSDSHGNIYIASFKENKIYKISVYGKKTEFSNSTLIKGPVGIALDSQDNLFVANYLANNIIKISPEGASSTVFAEISKPYCIFYDSMHNRIYATEQNSNKLIKYDL